MRNCILKETEMSENERKKDTEDGVRKKNQYIYREQEHEEHYTVI